MVRAGKIGGDKSGAGRYARVRALRVKRRRHDSNGAGALYNGAA